MYWSSGGFFRYGGSVFWRGPGHLSIVELLLKQNPDINEECLYRETALHFAVRKGHEGVFRLLVQRGAKWVSQNMWGQSPLDLGRNRKGDKRISDLDHFEQLMLLEQKNKRRLFMGSLSERAASKLQDYNQQLRLLEQQQKSACLWQSPRDPDKYSGLHALQDYHMQLMLLEQQNKKRLMSERLERN